jgi:hypothetical protein
MRGRGVFINSRCMDNLLKKRSSIPLLASGEDRVKYIKELEQIEIWQVPYEWI